MSEHRFVCPCGQPLTCDDSLLGQEIACPTCGTMLQLGEKPAPPSLHTRFAESLQHASEQRQNLQKQSEDEKTESVRILRHQAEFKLEKARQTGDMSAVERQKALIADLKNDISMTAEDDERKLCQCYFCQHKYHATLRSLGNKIKCPNCNQEIFCQEYVKTLTDYFNDNGITTSYAYKEKIFIDDNSKQLILYFNKMHFKESHYFFLIPYECILGWDINQDASESITKTNGNIEGKRKAAIVGTVLAGPVGTMVGMAGQKKVNLTSTSVVKCKYHLNIILNDIEHSNFSITDLSLTDVEAITARLNVIKYYNEKNQRQNQKIKRIEMSQKTRDYFKEDILNRIKQQEKKDAFPIFRISIITVLIPIILGFLLRSLWTIIWIAIAIPITIAATSSLLTIRGEKNE